MEDLKLAESLANLYLKRVKLRVEGRYGYTAIDLTHPDGRVIDTLIAGLTKRQALQILQAIKRLLSFETA